MNIIISSEHGIEIAFNITVVLMCGMKLEKIAGFYIILTVSTFQRRCFI
jgi:hypothetical protein